MRWVEVISAPSYGSGGSEAVPKEKGRAKAPLFSTVAASHRSPLFVRQDEPVVIFCERRSGSAAWALCRKYVDGAIGSTAQSDSTNAASTTPALYSAVAKSPRLSPRPPAAV